MVILDDLRKLPFDMLSGRRCLSASSKQFVIMRVSRKGTFSGKNERSCATPNSYIQRHISPNVDLGLWRGGQLGAGGYGRHQSQCAVCPM